MKSANLRATVATLCAGALAAGYFGGRPLLERVEFARAEADVQVTRQELSTVEDLSTVFRHVGRVVEPSVVNIRVLKTVRETAPNIPDEDQFRRFFRDHGGEFPFGDEDQGKGFEETGTGSGVIMDADGQYGYILTNNHVAGDGGKMTITLADGRVIDGADVKLLGADPKSDLALVQIKADRLIPAKWGDSADLEKGDWVMAFGSPLGYSGSMTHGIVSALNRNEVIPDKNEYENFIQVDAPINPGNSGGPLVNIHGEVVGINTAIATVSGGFQGIGFAIPSNQAKAVYTALKEHGKVVRGWLGVEIKSVAEDRDTAQYFGFKGDSGVIIEGVSSQSPAAGSLQQGDVVVAMNGQSVNDSEHLRDLVAATAPNTKITLKIFRGDKMQDIDVTVGDQPENMELAFSHGGNDSSQGAPEDTDSARELGLSLQTLNQDIADKLGISDVKSGVVITDVANDSAAAEAGLKPGQVITEVGHAKVHNAAEAAAALKGAAASGGIPVYVVASDGSRFVFLKTNQPQN